MHVCEEALRLLELVHVGQPEGPAGSDRLPTRGSKEHGRLHQHLESMQPAEAPLRVIRRPCHWVLLRTLGNVRVARLA